MTLTTIITLLQLALSLLSSSQGTASQPQAIAFANQAVSLAQGALTAQMLAPSVPAMTTPIVTAPVSTPMAATSSPYALVITSQPMAWGSPFSFQVLENGSPIVNSQACNGTIRTFDGPYLPKDGQIASSTVLSQATILAILNDNRSWTYDSQKKQERNALFANSSTISDKCFMMAPPQGGPTTTLEIDYNGNSLIQTINYQ